MKLNYTACLIILNLAVLNLAFEIPDQLKSQARKIHDRCKATTGATDELIKSSSGSAPVDRSVQCYLHCLFDIVGLIDETHVVHLEYLLDILPDETHESIQNLAKVCGTQHGTDGCETAFLTVKCYLETDPTLRNKMNFMTE